MEDEAAELEDEAAEHFVSLVLAATLVGMPDGRSALVALEDKAAESWLPLLTDAVCAFPPVPSLAEVVRGEVDVLAAEGVAIGGTGSGTGADFALDNEGSNSSDPGGAG